MRNRKYGAIIILLIILVGVIVLSMRPKPLQKADPQTRGQTNNPPISAAAKVSDIKQVEATTNSETVYLTQEQQDSRQHKWGEPNLPGVDKACQNGADAKVTLRIIDSRGAPVPEADIQMAFFPQDSYETAKITKGLTDKDGLFVASGKTVDDISFTAMKTNYYVTSRKFHFYWRGTECVKDGHWQPWNPTLEVVLKEKRKPIPMIAKKVESKFPNAVPSMGFDFLVGDWVAPHGKGVTADMLYIYEEDRTDKNNVDLKLTLAFPGSGNGCYMRKKEKFSTLMSDYEARLDNYSSNIVSRVYKQNGAYVYEDQITDDDYLVYRVRSSCDEKGNVVSAHYGKIYGPLEAPRDLSRIIKVVSYFNPTPNDRNLEFDGKNNLLKPDWKDSWPRNP